MLSAQVFLLATIIKKIARVIAGEVLSRNNWILPLRVRMTRAGRCLNYFFFAVLFFGAVK